ncbi:MAG: hypothetical protein MI784_13250 [Cytophagales bacterium]|nr:hypothetical protein [Cytophagales bacterium]
MQEFKLYKVRDFGDMISDTFEFIKCHFRLLLKGYLYFVLPFAVLAGGSSALWLKGLAGLSGANSGSPDDVWDVFGALFGSTNFYLIVIAGGIVFLLNMLFVFGVFREHERGGGEMVFEKIWRVLPKYLLPMFATGLIVYLLIFLGTMLCVIPGIALGVYWSLALPSVVLEDTPVGQSLSRSYALVKNNWLKTFLLILVVTILASILNMFVTLPLELAVQLPEIFSIVKGDTTMMYEGISTVSLVAVQVVKIAWQLFVFMFTVAFYGILFYSYKEEKEHVSVAQSLDGLGKSAE